MKKNLTLVLMTVVSLVSYSQTIATTNDGRKVQLFSDSTWRYIEEVVVSANLDDISCETIMEVQVDDMAGTREYLPKKNIKLFNPENPREGIGTYAATIKKGYLVWSNNLIGAGCLENAKIIILFRDSSKSETFSHTEFNCKGDASMYFGEIFMDKEIFLTSYQLKKSND